jgi:hypothetical protein
MNNSLFLLLTLGVVAGAMGSSLYQAKHQHLHKCPERFTAIKGQRCAHNAIIFDGLDLTSLDASAYSIFLRSNYTTFIFKDSKLSEDALIFDDIANHIQQLKFIRVDAPWQQLLEDGLLSSPVFSSLKSITFQENNIEEIPSQFLYANSPLEQIVLESNTIEKICETSDLVNYMNDGIVSGLPEPATQQWTEYPGPAEDCDESQISTIIDELVPEISEASSEDEACDDMEEAATSEAVKNLPRKKVVNEAMTSGKTSATATEDCDDVTFSTSSDVPSFLLEGGKVEFISAAATSEGDTEDQLDFIIRKRFGSNITIAAAADMLGMEEADEKLIRDLIDYRSDESSSTVDSNLIAKIMTSTNEDGKLLLLELNKLLDTYYGNSAKEAEVEAALSPVTLNDVVSIQSVSDILRLDKSITVSQIFRIWSTDRPEGVEMEDISIAIRRLILLPEEELNQALKDLDEASSISNGPATTSEISPKVLNDHLVLWKLRELTLEQIAEILEASKFPVSSPVTRTTIAEGWTSLEIALVVIGSIVGFIALSTLLYCIFSRKKPKRQMRRF